MFKPKTIALVKVSSGMMLGMLLGLTFIIGNSVF